MLNHIKFRHKLNIYNSLVKQQKLENDEMNEKSIWIHQELNNGLTDQESFLTQKMVKMKFAYKVFHAFEVQDTDALTRFQNQQWEVEKDLIRVREAISIGVLTSMRNARAIGPRYKFPYLPKKLVID